MNGWIRVKAPRPCGVCELPAHNRYSVQYRPPNDVFTLFTITIARCDIHAPRVSGAGSCLHETDCRAARKRAA